MPRFAPRRRLSRIALACALVVGFAGGAIALAAAPAIAQLTSASDPQSLPQVSAGEDHACGVEADGTLTCWGDNASGKSSPPSGTFTAVSAGPDMTCAIRTDQTITCFGASVYSSLNPPAGAFTTIDVDVVTGCGIKTDSTVNCWGYAMSDPAPSSTFVSIGTGGHTGCGVLTSGQINCWTGFTGSTIPTGTFTSVDSTGGWGCAVRNDGDVICFGMYLPAAIDVTRAGSYTQVSVGDNYACALDADGAVSCWGTKFGAIAPEPTGEFSSISVGDGSACGTLTSGKARCWAGPSGVTDFTVTGGSFSTTAGDVVTETLSTTVTRPASTWSVTDGALPAGISLSSAGDFSGTPTAAATQTLTVETDGILPASKEVTITVDAAALASIAATVSPASITAGSSAIVTLTGADSYGNATTAPSVDSTTEGATTTPGDQVSPTSAGIHSFTVTSGALTTTSSVTVVAGAPISIELTLTPSTIVAGTATVPSVTGEDAYGNPTGPLVATYETDGNGQIDATQIRGIGSGTETITATVGSLTDDALLTVNPGPTVYVLVSFSPTTITAGGTTVATATGTDVYGNVTGPVAAVFNGVPGISGNNITETVAGDHEIMATFGSIVGQRTLTVTAGPLAAITTTLTPSTFVAGGSTTATSTGADAYGNSLGSVAAFYTGVAGISGSSISSTTAGGYTITGHYATFSDDAALTVTPAAPVTLALTLSSNSVTAGTAVSATVDGTDSYGNATGDLTTTSSFDVDGAAATSTILATAAGSHTVTAHYAGLTDSAPLTVATGPTSTITLTLAPATIVAGGSSTATVVGSDAFSNPTGDLTSASSFTLDGGSASSSIVSTVAGAHTVTATYAALTDDATLTVTSLAVVTPPVVTPPTTTKPHVTAPTPAPAASATPEPTATPTPTVTPTATPTPSDTATSAAPQTTDDAGPPWLIIGGVLLVIVLGAGIWVIAARRRAI